MRKVPTSLVIVIENLDVIIFKNKFLCDKKISTEVLIFNLNYSSL